MKRLLSALLAVVMIVTAFALTSCNNEPDPTQAPTTAPTPTQGNEPVVEPTQGGEPAVEPTQGGEPVVEPTEGGEPAVEPTQGGTTPDVGGSDDNDGYSKHSDYLDVDFGGFTFRFTTTSDWVDEVGRWCTEKEIAVDSRDGGTPIDTAVYDRNAVMKRLYNCNIEAVENTSNLVGNDILNGTSEYAFACQQGGFYTVNSNFVNVKNLDLDMDIGGWNVDFFDALTVTDNNGIEKLYTIDGAFNLSTYRATWILMCNLDLYEQNFTESLFDIVASGNWTMDKMMELCAAVKQDTGDSVWTPGDDILGLMSTTYNVPALITSAGLQFVQRDENNALITGADIIKAGNAYAVAEKICEFYKDGWMYTGGYTEAQNQLEAGKTLFIGEVMDVLERMKDNEALNVTAVPQPKFSADQDRYLSYVNGKGTTYGVSKNACEGNYEMVADFLNLFVFHSDKIVIPAFKNTFGSIYCQNERAPEMLEQIMNGRSYDFAYYKTALYGTLTSELQQGTNNVNKAATKWAASVKSNITSYLESLTKAENVGG